MGDSPLGPYDFLGPYLAAGIYEGYGGSLHTALGPYIALYCM